MSSLLTSEQIRQITSARILAFPTDTVAGIFARIDDTVSISRIFEIKGRALQKTMLTMLPDLKTIEHYFEPTEFEWSIIQANSPGQITFLLPLKAGIELSPDLYQVERGEGTVGFRIPQSAIAQEILKLTGPLAQTSLNISGTPPICNVEEIPFADHIDFIYPFHNHPIIPSTIIRFDNDQITVVRQGAAQVKMPS